MNERTDRDIINLLGVGTGIGRLDANLLMSSSSGRRPPDGAAAEAIPWLAAAIPWLAAAIPWVAEVTPWPPTAPPGPARTEISWNRKSILLIGNI